MPDWIRIAGLELMVRIGVTEIEKTSMQRVTVSVDLRPENGFAHVDDHLARTVDYARVALAIRQIGVTFEPRLLETLAEKIAAVILHEFPVAEVKVKVCKFVLRDCDHVAVLIHRAR